MFETYFRSSPITCCHVTILNNCSVKQDKFYLNIVISCDSDSFMAPFGTQAVLTSTNHLCFEQHYVIY